MPNLITQFDNGTFEAVDSSWGQIFPDFTRSDDFAQSGTYSGKLVRLSGLGSYGQKGFIEFPAVVGQIYKVEAYVRTDGEASRAFTGILTSFPEDDILDFVMGRGDKTNLAWKKISLTYRCNVLSSGKTLISFTNFNSGSGVIPAHLQSIYDGLNIPPGNDTNNSFTYYDSLTADVSTLPPDPQFGGRKLYYIENVFLMSDGVNLYSVEEPIGWDKILLNITFDRVIRGFKFEFTDKDAVLDFDEAAGRSILDQIYKEQGIDGVAGLKFGELDSLGNLEILYEAQINFSQFTIGRYTSKAQCERQSLAVKFAARYDAKFELEQPTTLSNIISIPDLPLIDVFLHARELDQNIQGIYNTAVALTEDIIPEYEPGLSPSDPEVWTFVPPIKFLNNDIQGFNEPVGPDGTLVYSGLSLPVGVPFRQITFSVRLAFQFNLANNSGGMACGFRLYKRSQIARDPQIPVMPLIPPFIGDSNTNFITLPQFPSISFPPSGRVSFSGQVNGGIILYADEALFIKCFIYKPNGTTGGAFSDINFSSPNLWGASFQDVTPKFPILFKGYRSFDVLSRMLYMITDSPGSFRSDFFETGCAKDHIMASGKQIRSIPEGKLITSFRDVLTSFDALFNLGFSFERDNVGGEWGRLEPVSYFFQDIEMIKLNTISNYKKRPANEYIFNEIEFGFSKFPQGNQTASANDFMTKHNYLTVIKNTKNKLTKLCQFILSPYYIQYTAENSIQYNSNGQYETDNDVFLISVNRDVTSLIGLASFTASTRELIINKIAPIVPGESITITGSAFNNVTGIVSQSYSQSVFPRTVITFRTDVSIVDEPNVNITITFSLRDIPKRDEQFATIENVFLPKTVYNLEHHIKRIFTRWSNFFLTGMTYTLNSGTSKIRFLSGSNNTKVGTRLKDTELCPFVETGAYLMKRDSDDEVFQNLDKPLFKHNYIECDAPMTWQTLNLLRRGFEGRHPDDKNYGYFSILNQDGIYEKGFLVDLKFNPVTQLVKLILIEKYDG